MATTSTTTITKWIFLAVLSLAMKPEILIQGQQAPCLFAFGDSLFDNGNNNPLITLLKANYLPYGIDYPAGPSGRFTNGQNQVDFLARILGFANPIPPFVTTRGSDVLRGLNYASGGSGILDETGAIGGDRFSMNRQLRNHQATIVRIVSLLGNQTAANSYLRRCLYAVNMGSNDYILNYYLPLSPSKVLYTRASFAERLIQTYSQQLTNLGARKITVFGLAMIGCIPEELALYPTKATPCVDSINNAVEIFNNRLISLVNNFNNNFHDANFTYINIYSIASAKNPPVNGITVNNAPCCEVGIIGLCAPNGIPCNIRNQYYFWDNFHPTQIIDNATIARAYNAMLPDDTIPVDIRTLLQQ